MKKIIACFSAVLLAVFCFSIFAVSAAESSSATSQAASSGDKLIYFDATGWKNYSTIYCHIWENGGDSFFGWQAKAEQCQKVSGNTYSYDLSKLSDSDELSGGMQKGKDYCVIFSANTGAQTYDITIGSACIGDTLKLSDRQIENPVDDRKHAYEAVWTKNGSKFGPHIAITSIGNFVGSKFCEHETAVQLIGKWLLWYYDSSYVDVEDTLVRAFKKFGVKSGDVEKIYAYVVSHKTDENEKKILSFLEAASKKTFPVSTKTDDKKAVTEIKGSDISAKPLEILGGKRVKVNKITLSKTKLTLIKGKKFTLKAKVYPSNATNKKVKWTSSNKKVATVSSSGKITAKKPGTAVIKATAKDGSKKSAKCKVKVTLIKVKKLSISKKSAKLTIGKSLSLKVKITPKNATVKKLKWTSSNKKVATVSSSGKVVAKGRGTAVIKAAATDGSKKSVSCKLTVQTIAVKSISLNCTKLQMTENEEYKLKAVVSPSNATNKELDWESSDESVAYVSWDGTISAYQEGSAIITATATDGSNQYAYCELTVVKEPEVKISGFTLYPYSLSMSVGDRSGISAMFEPSDATDKSLSWLSSDTSVATVNGLGEVTAVGEGTAVITATAKDGSGATAQVTVKVGSKQTSADGLNTIRNWLTLNGEENTNYYYKEIGSVRLRVGKTNHEFMFQTLNNKSGGLNVDFTLRDNSYSKSVKGFMMKYYCYLADFYYDIEAGEVTSYTTNSVSPGYTFTDSGLKSDVYSCMSSIDIALRSIGTSLAECGVRY